MTVKELLNTVGKRTKKSQREISKLIGISPQLLNQKVNMGLLKFSEACRICDAAGMQVALFDIDNHKRVLFDTDSFSTGGNGVRYDDAVDLLREIGLELAIVDAASGIVITSTKSGYGRRVRVWIDGVEYDTLKSSAISTGLNTESHKYGGTEKYNVDDPRELYQKSDGAYFFAVYKPGRGEDIIEPCDENTAQAFINLHGTIK